MKLLVLTSHYPDLKGGHDRVFVHVRSIYYKRHGMDVVVLNFNSKEDYQIDGIPVISLASYRRKYGGKKKFDLALVHSANLRNHYLFLKRYEKDFPHFIFFFHGQEVLYHNYDYPEPYWYMKNSPLRKHFRDFYDHTKLFLWRRYFLELLTESDFVFVSYWLKDRFFRNMHLSDGRSGLRCHVISNSVGSFFENNHYNRMAEKKYDYITIRGNLDGSKYCIDLVVELAKQNPDRLFLIMGTGHFFEHVHKPDNITLISGTFGHEEMKSYLDSAKYALMLSREDTQGVMACEMAAYGMPVITSDIEICREIFYDSPNVILADHDADEIELKAMERIIRDAGSRYYEKDPSYYAENTMHKEMLLFQKYDRR